MALGGGQPWTENSEYREQASASSTLKVEETKELLLPSIPSLPAVVIVKKVVLAAGVDSVGMVRVLVGVTVT